MGEPRSTLDEIAAVTVRNHAGRIPVWQANALVRVVAAEHRRRKKAEWDALPWHVKLRRRATQRINDVCWRVRVAVDVLVKGDRSTWLDNEY